MKKFFTLDDINNVIEVFEEFLDDYGVVIPESEKEKVEENDTENGSLIYGMVYGDLQGRLLEYFEDLHSEGKIVDVLNSWDGEIEGWNYDEI